MTITIDWTRCDGHGLCAQLLPEQITLDEWGYPLINTAQPADAKAIRRTVAACPALALYLEADGAPAARPLTAGAK